MKKFTIEQLEQIKESLKDLRPKKSKGIAIILALFLGGFGIHQFYCGRILQGLLYLMFFWTFIPALISVIDILFIAFCSKETFDKYCQ